MAIVGRPLVVGSAHVSFWLDTPADAEVILCFDEGLVGVMLRGNLSTRALQRIPLRSFERHALAHLRASRDQERSQAWDKDQHTRHLARGGTSTPEEWAVINEPWRSALDKASKTPRRSGGKRERYLAETSARYLVLCGESGSPTKALAEELHLSTATVRDQLGDARRRKLLVAAAPGRPGGTLTPKALALLSADEED